MNCPVDEYGYFVPTECYDPTGPQLCPWNKACPPGTGFTQEDWMDHRRW